MSRLSVALESNKKVITAEMGPPKGIDVSDILSNAKKVKDIVTAFNITDNQRSVMRMSPLATSKIFLDNNLEPILQLTCRDRNRLALQSDLLGAGAMGIQNILALTGDHVKSGDHPQAKPVFDLDSVQLLYTINKLSSGEDLAGKPLKGKPTFYSGAVVNPVATNLEIHVWRMAEKIRMGAKYFQTQVVFDPEVLKNFMSKIEPLNTKILAGVLLVKSAKMAMFLNEKVPGVSVPEWVIQELSSTDHPTEAGIKIANHLSKEFLKIADGVHVMAIHEEHRLTDILKGVL
jgi:methylenetetrahydrofolate reductase (NADPH)